MENCFVDIGPINCFNGKTDSLPKSRQELARKSMVRLLAKENMKNEAAHDNQAGDHDPAVGKSFRQIPNFHKTDAPFHSTSDP